MIKSGNIVGGAGAKCLMLVNIILASYNVMLVQGGERISLISVLMRARQSDPGLGQNDPLPRTELDFNRAQPLAPQPYYSREEMSCFEERKVYYEGKCRELLMRGPCDDGQWLVLDQSSQGIRPVCSPRLCSTDKAFWEPTGECLHLSDKTKCNKKETTLQVDSLGYGACKCMHGLARAMASNGVCYKLYYRGFCDPGFVVAIDPQAGLNPATCIPDVCNSTSTDQIMLPYAGSCYPDGSREPCPVDEALTVDVHSGKPTCAPDLLEWNIIHVPPKCPHVDHFGNCRDRLIVQLESDYYTNELKTDKAKHRSKFSISKG